MSGRKESCRSGREKMLSGVGRTPPYPTSHRALEAAKEPIALTRVILDRSVHSLCHSYGQGSPSFCLFHQPFLFVQLLGLETDKDSNPGESSQPLTFIPAQYCINPRTKSVSISHPFLPERTCGVGMNVRATCLGISGRLMKCILPGGYQI